MNRDYPDNTDCLSPQIYLMYVVRHCFEYFGYRVSGNVFHDDDMKKLLLYGNYALDYKTPLYFVKANKTVDQSGSGTATILFNSEVSDANNCFNPVTSMYEIKGTGWHKVTSRISVLHNNAGTNFICELKLMKDTTLIDKNTITGSGLAVVYPFLETSFALDSGDVGSDLSLEIYMGDESGGSYVDGNFQIYSGQVLFEAVSESNLNRYKKSFNYSDIVPDKKISEFLQAFYKTFGIIPFFDHKMKTVELVYLNDLITNPACTGFNQDVIKDSMEVGQNNYEGIRFSFDRSQNDDFVEDLVDYENNSFKGEYDGYFDMPQVNDEIDEIARIKSINNIQIWRVEETEEGGSTVIKTFWDILTDDFKDYTDGDENKEIKSGFLPMLMHFAEGLENSDIEVAGKGKPYWLVPKVKQKGTSPSFGTGINDPGLRIMFFHGFQTMSVYDGTEVSYNYPLASFGRRDANGDLISSTSFQLTWQGTDGLIATFYQSYINWLQRRQPVEFQKLLTAKEVNLFDFSDKKRLFEIVMLLREVQLKVDSRSLGVAKIKGYIV